MAKLPAVIDSLDKVAEPLREMYLPSEDGKSFVLDTDITAHPGTAPLQKNSAAILREKRALEERLKAFDGLDPETVKSALDAQAKIEEEKAKAAGNFEELKRQQNERFEKARKEWDGEKTVLLGTIERRVSDDETRAAISLEDGNAALLMPHVRSQIKVVKDGDEYVAQVVDRKGNQRFTASGDPMSIRDLVKEMREKDEYKPAFAAPAASGTGARGSQRQATNGDIVMTAEQAKDVAQYRRAREEAAKHGGRVLIQG